MYPTYGILLFFLLLFIWGWHLRSREKTAVAVHHIRKKKGEIKIMEELAKRFTGKECIIYTITSNDGSIQGTIKDVSGGGLVIEDAQGQMQIVNLEYVTRIREYPRNKKGKKKSVVLD